MISSKYNHLLADYPETVTKEQLCRICHISKRKATWLLENGLITCSDTGKKTRRFTIKMKDILFYLEDREAHPEHYITPKGIFTNGYKSRHVSCKFLITQENYKDFMRFVIQQLKGEKDILTLGEAVKLMQTESLGTYIKQGNLKAYSYRGRYIIAKDDLIDSYLRVVRENRGGYQRFHMEMVGKYFAGQEQKETEEVAYGMEMRR